MQTVMHRHPARQLSVLTHGPTSEPPHFVHASPLVRTLSAHSEIQRSQRTCTHPTDAFAPLPAMQSDQVTLYLVHTFSPHLPSHRGFPHFPHTASAQSPPPRRWTQIKVRPCPSPRFGHALCLVGKGGCLLMFGGCFDTGGFMLRTRTYTQTAELWFLDLTSFRWGAKWYNGSVLLKQRTSVGICLQHINTYRSQSYGSSFRSGGCLGSNEGMQRGFFLCHGKLSRAAFH